MDIDVLIDLIKGDTKDLTYNSRDAKKDNNELKLFVDELSNLMSKKDKSEILKYDYSKICFFVLAMSANGTFDEVKKVVGSMKKSMNLIFDDPDKSFDKFIDIYKTLEEEGVYTFAEIKDKKAKNYIDTFSFPEALMTLNSYNLVTYMTTLLNFTTSVKESQKNDIFYPLEYKLKNYKHLYHATKLDVFLKDLIDGCNAMIRDNDILVDASTKQIATNNEVINYLEEVKTRSNGEIALNNIDLMEISSNWFRDLRYDVLTDIFEKVTENMYGKYLDTGIKNVALMNSLDSNKTDKVLYIFGINPKSIRPSDYETLKDMDPILLEANIKTLLEFGFEINDIFTKHFIILVTLNYEKVLNLNLLIKKKALSKENIVKNPRLINKIKRLKLNYDILANIIDFDNAYYDESILQKNVKDLKDELSILAQYNLTKNNYMFLLCHYEYLNIYDLIIEHEIPTYLFIAICKTKNPLLTIKRIMIAKELGIDYETPTHNLRKNVTCEEHASCYDEDIEEFIANFVPFVCPDVIEGNRIDKILKYPLVEELDEKSRLDDYYVFGDVIVSRPKLLKRFEHLLHENKKPEEYFIPCAISDSIYTEKDFFTLKEMVNSKKLG